jgi:hypothetical protein
MLNEILSKRLIFLPVILVRSDEVKWIKSDSLKLFQLKTSSFTFSFDAEDAVAENEIERTEQIRKMIMRAFTISISISINIIIRP